MKIVDAFQQAPVRNESVIAAQVYSHSGEFSPQVVDLEMSGRGMSLLFIRKYRSSRHQTIGAVGRGWTFTYAKRLEQSGSEILYHDGFGRIHRFAAASGHASFVSPDGFYAILAAEAGKFLLKQRSGDLFVFEHPDFGGRLLSIKDRNGNSIAFEYRDSEITVTDTLGRRADISLENDRLARLKDHAQREWQYLYDHNGCLIEVIQPAMRDLPDRPRIRYAYDQEFRLISITNPNGQIFLENFYDDQGLVREQKSGAGTLEFQYEAIDKTEAGFPVYRTQVKLKNGGLLSLKHDRSGHVVERIQFLSASSLSSEDRNGVDEGTVALVTTSNYNLHGELIQRTWPAGNSAEWLYDQGNQDRRAEGNLVRVTEIPAVEPGGSGLPLVTRYTHESTFQQLASVIDARGHATLFEYDARGNRSKKIYPSVTFQNIANHENETTVQSVELMDRFEYNSAGQLVRFADSRGASIAYFYFPATDPTGAGSLGNSGSLTQTPGGYVARIVRDPATEDRRLESEPANLTTEFGYDDFGNITGILDGKGNPTRLEYDAHNQLLSATSRQPSNYKASFRYDPNGNMIEGAVSFDHREYDPTKQEVASRTTVVRQGFGYNNLNNVVRSTVRAGDRETVRTFIRDAAENVVREISPMGNSVDYGFDERNRIVSRRLGAGAEEEIEIRHTYTPNGRLSSIVDGRGHTTSYHYDGFHRYEGFTNARGTSKRQWRDEVGNVTRIEVFGEAVTADERGEPTAGAQSLLESWFQYDELNRLVRMKRAWRDPATGEALGQGRYDGSAGLVSSVVQYGHHHLPSKIWRETGNIVELRYDGANRVTTVSDETGETVSIGYDDNSNPIRVERLGPPAGEDDRFRQVISQQFDELDRLIARSVNEDIPESYAYNALGSVMDYRNPAGVTVRILHDRLGRLAGRVMTATTAESAVGMPTEQMILQQVLWDDDDRMIARVNARGNATSYEYDAMNRLRGIVYADGATRRFERDAAGNITRVTDPNGAVIANHFDDLNRLVERHVENANGEGRQLERFIYDGLNRLVAALTGDAITVRRYDSLSRLLEETQSARTIRYGYDAAGNSVIMRYPSGQEIQKCYDVLGRVTEVREQDALIATYSYGSSRQLRQQELGGVLDVAFDHEPGKDWLTGVTYRSTDTGEIVEGNKYRYDAAGNCIEEVQLRAGEDCGERYFYDSSSRLVKVQYGVERLSDPDSSFEREVLYELSPTSTWERRTTRDASGQTIEQAEGEANKRERYLSLGHRRFQYDANGNLILEEDGEGHTQKQYTYDHANRLVRVEMLDADARVAQTIEYSYDGLNRQVLKRIIRDGVVREFARLWDGRALIEEWENSSLSKSFIHGSSIGKPLTMTLHSEGEERNYFYALNGLGSVTALVDGPGQLAEAYRYDVFGQPFLDANGSQGFDRPLSSSATANVLFTLGQFYDADTGISVIDSSSFDASTGQTWNEPHEPLGPYVGTFSEMPVPMTPDPRVPPEGGMSVLPEEIEIEDYEASIGANMTVLGLALFSGIEVGAVGAGLHLPKLFGPIGHVGWELFWSGVEIFGEPAGGHSSSGSGTKPPGSSGGGGHGGSPSQGSGGRPSGQPEDDYGHGGGSKGDYDGSKGNSGKSASNKEEQKEPDTQDIEYDENGGWYDKRTGEKGGPNDKMPNPEDPSGGTGEGPDKEWWRSLPYASALSLAEALKSPWKYDERHETLYLSLVSPAGTGNLIGALMPQLIEVDEGGETLTLNLKGARSTSASAGATTSDGWGDKPRTLAEALAAPRIRDASTSRF